MSEQDWGSATRRGIAWSTTTFLAGKALTFVTTVVLARLLVPSEFGVVAAILIYLQLLELISDIGLAATVQYEQEKGITARVQTAFTLNLVLSVVLFAIGVAAAPLIAGFFHVSGDTDLFRLAALNLLLRGTANIHDALLLRDLAFNRRIVSQLSGQGARAIVSIALAVAGLGAASLVIGMLAGTVVWAVVVWAITGFRPNLTIQRSAVRPMITYGGGASALEVIAVISTRADVVTIGRVLGDTALGLYTIAYRIPELIIESIAWNVSIVAFPALARKRVSDEQGMAAAALKLARYQVLYAAPLAAGLAVLATPLIVVLFGTKWTEAGGVMSAIAVMVGVSSVAYPIGDVFKALGLQRVLVGLNLLQLPLLIAAIVLAADAGIVAVAWVRAAEMALYTGMIVAAATRVTSIRPGQVLSAMGPGAAAALGVVIGAGAVRLAWPEIAVGPLVAGVLAGALGGTLSLRLLAPSSFGEAREQMVELLRPVVTRRGGDPTLA
ncbi:MAG: oligosaccharide flippase family protein [Solirubrobacteraceae bacterium]